MLGRDFEDEVWSRFVFELVIWPNRLLWKDELNPRVRCAFGNVFLLNSDQYQHISFGGLYVKIRSAVQKLWTKKWFCTVSLASISYSVTWKMCLLLTQISFLRVPAKCFPQSWVGGSYLFLSFWWCTMYLSRQQAKVPFQIRQIRTVWHFEVPIKKSNYIGNG